MTLSRLVLPSVLSLLASSILLAASFNQCLPSVDMGVIVTSPETTTIRVALPENYGLTASEAEASWEPLNEPREASATIRNGTSTLDLGRVTYCVTKFVWADPPPPLAWFHVRIGDFTEAYTVWRKGEESGYWVKDSDGDEIPASRASWLLTVGELERQPGGPDERPRYLLHLTIQSQDPSVDPGAADA
jgi:hypothetical protein